MAPEQLEGREADAPHATSSRSGACSTRWRPGKKAFSGATPGVADLLDHEGGAGAHLGGRADGAAGARSRRAALPRQGSGGPLAERGGPRQRAQVDRGGRLADGNRRSRSSPGRRRRARGCPGPRRSFSPSLGFAAGRLLRSPPRRAPVLRSSIELPPKTGSRAVQRVDRAVARRTTLVFAATGADGQAAHLGAPDGRIRGPAAGRHGRRDDPVLVARRPLDRLLRRAEVEEGPRRRRRRCRRSATPPTAGARAGASTTSSSSRPRRSAGLCEVSAAGGAPTPLTRVAQGGRDGPLAVVSAGREAPPVLLGNQTSDKDKRAPSRSWTSPPARPTAGRAGKQRRTVRRSPATSSSSATATSWPSRFDPSSAEDDRARAVPVAEGVLFSPSAGSATSRSRRPDGSSSRAAEPRAASQLTWFDVDGKELGQVGEPANVF